MADLSRIHSDKEPIRRHYLVEWLAARHLGPMDLVDLLNDPERSSDYGYVDKSQVYRWLKGQMPQKAMQARIAAALGMDDPADLLRDPVDDWAAKFFKDRDRAEVEKMIQMLEIAFPRKKAG